MCNSVRVAGLKPWLVCFSFMLFLQSAAAVQVAFGPGAPSSSSMRTYGAPKIENLDQGSSLGVQGSDDDQFLSTLPLATSVTGTDVSMDIDVVDASNSNVKNEYIEIWVRRLI